MFLQAKEEHNLDFSKSFLLGDTEKDIPGWIQDHITNAENYIVQAAKGYYDQADKQLGNNIPKPENANYAVKNNGK